jgi:sulfur carrier protein ThiS
VSLGRAGSYELLELLGEGGVGQVYSARDPVLGRQVAIKMLRPELSRNREFLDRFYSEAQRLGDLNHPNITILYGLQFDGDSPFMVMELVRGLTLKELLERARQMPPRVALAVLSQALAGLAYAHRSWVIHRDIKPSNLMVTEGGVVKIMDFGIARVRGSQHMTRAGQAFLTPLYASPEQIRGEEVDERSDIYSLGIVAFEMLAGRPPFSAETDFALSLAHLEKPPPPLTPDIPDLDPQFEAAVMRALAKKPEERFAGAAEFASAVNASAIRGDAPDIVQEFIGGLRPIAMETRKIEIGSEFRAPSGARSAAAVAAEPDPGATLVEPRAAARPPDPQRGGPVKAIEPPPHVATSRLPAALFGALAIALALGIGAWEFWPAHHPAPEPAKTAALDIRTKPSGATIYIDGKRSGKTPVSLKDVAPGSHHIKADLPGYQPVSLSVSLEPGQSLPEKLKLVPKPAQLDIRTSPPGAAISIDGKPIGKSPAAQPIAQGPHVIVAALAGYRSESASVELRPGQSLPVDLTLEALLAGLDIRSTPPGAALSIDGKPIGKAPATQQITPGKHLVEAALGGFKAASLPIDAKPGETMPVNIELAALPPPTLGIATVPAGAALFLDGKAIGKAPKTIEQARPGKHLIAARLDNYEPQSTSVDLQPGETSRVDLQLKMRRPDLQGTVKGAMSASRIKIGVRWIELYGIDDPKLSDREHIQKLAQDLAAARGQIACYKKPHNKYQCYVGSKDLALTVLQQGIARLGTDAPAEYREAVQAQNLASDRM